MNTKPSPGSTATPARPTLALKSKPPLASESPAETYVCWRVGGSRPKRKHTSLQSALAERTRILKMHPPGTVVLVYALTLVYGGPGVVRR